MGAKTKAREERIGRVGQRRQVVIPREILESLDLREGDFVAFSPRANGVFVKPKRLVVPDDVLTPAEAKRVRQGMEQIKDGQFKLWRDVKHALDHSGR
ncbi:MAG TPA: AbrB/MazE/SpoVT family DNA-binding domain-containing protein [Terriglobia bacterium]|nr:AbrB/MazE/SpoVT family DNA-binding domain-containing protein [Terriglobia bacterium]